MGFLGIIGITLAGYLYQYRSIVSTMYICPDGRIQDIGPNYCLTASSTKVTADENVKKDWKAFTHERDGYSVMYPAESGEIETYEVQSYLKEYGFETSLTFIRYGGWADVYIFKGNLGEAIEGYKLAIKGGRSKEYVSTSDILIDGKKGKIATWKDSATSKNENVYFIEMLPTKTLLILGPEEFVRTFKFF